MDSSGQDEENSLAQEIPEWTTEFVKTFVQTGDLIYRELGGGTESTTAKIIKGGATALAGTSALAGGPNITVISKTMDISFNEFDKSGQENDRLALEHSINPNGRTKDFQMNYRKILIKCALQICHSYEIQFRCVYRKLKQNSLSLDSITTTIRNITKFIPGMKINKKTLEKSQMQGIQKLAAYAAYCCVSHLIEKQKFENPHDSVTNPSFVSKIKSWCSQLMVDGIRVQWSSQDKEVSMTTAQFFQIPTPAFYRHNQGTNDGETAVVEILAKKNADEKGKKNWHALRRPFDFESDPDYYKEQSFVEIKICLPEHEITDVGDLSKFVSKSYSTERIDWIYEKLISNPTLENAGCHQQINSKLDNVATSQSTLLAKWTELEPRLKLSQSGPIWFNVQDPTESFHGRVSFLEKLHVSIQQKQKPPEKVVTILSQLRIIGGLGGIGKTETARKYIQMHKKLHSYENFIWINAETKTSMENSFKNLAGKLSLQLKYGDEGQGTKKIQDIVEECYQIICQKSSLVVFDNAQYYVDSSIPNNDGIEPFLPKGLPPNLNVPFFLVTSRNLHWGSLQVESLEILHDDECVQLITQEMKSIGLKEVKEEEAKKLGRILDGLPLALTQAIAYIRDKFRPSKFIGSTYTLSDYLKECEDTQKKLLSYRPTDSAINKTVLTTWTVDFNLIETMKNGKWAIWLSQILSILSPDGVPEQLLREIVKSKLDETKLLDAIDILSRFALVKCWNVDGEGYKLLYLHRLVQVVILDKLRRKGRLEELFYFLLKPFMVTLCSLHELLYTERSAIVTNCVCVVENFKFILNTKKEKKKKEKRKGLKRIVLVFQKGVARELIDMYNLDQASILLEDVVDQLEKTPQDPLLYSTKCQIAEILHTQGKLEEAYELLKKVYDFQSTHLESEDDDLRWTLYELHSVLKDQKKFQEAEEIQRKIHVKNLAFVRSQNLKFDLDSDCNEEASKLVNKIYERGLEFINSDKTADSSQIMNLLIQGSCASLNVNMEFLFAMMKLTAEILNSKGRPDEAMEVYKIIHDKQIAKGYIDENVLQTLLEMGTAWFHQGKYQVSFELFNKVYKAKRLSNGNNSQVQMLMLKMTAALQEQGKNEKSLKMISELYKEWRTIYPPDHPDLLQTMMMMGDALKNCGKFQEAYDMWNDMYKIQMESKKPQCLDILWIRERISHVLWDLERYDESISILQNVLDTKSTKFPLNDPRIVVLSERLAEKKKMFSYMLKEQQSLTCLPNENEY